MIAIQHFNSRLTLTDIASMYEIHVQIKEAAQRAVLFTSIATNSRYKSFFIVFSKNSASISKLET